MATRLNLIAPHTLDFGACLKEPQPIREKLMALSLPFVRSGDEQLATWETTQPPRITDETDELLRAIEYDTPYAYQLTVYPSCLEIETMYRYDSLQEAQRPPWLSTIQQELHHLIRSFGGREAIFFPDQVYAWSAKLTDYLAAGASYDLIKRKLTKEVGPPVTELSQLTDEAFLPTTYLWWVDHLQPAD